MLFLLASVEASVSNADFDFTIPSVCFQIRLIALGIFAINRFALLIRIFMSILALQVFNITLLHYKGKKKCDMENYYSSFTCKFAESVACIHIRIYVADYLSSWPNDHKSIVQC